MLESALQAHGDIALSCAASKDGAFLYSGGNDGTLKVWRGKTMEILSPTRSEAIQGKF